MKKTEMVSKWLFIHPSESDPWISPVWGAVNDAVNAGKINRLPKEIYELGGAIYIRLNILPCIVVRLNSEVNQIYNEVSKYGDECVFPESQEGYSMQLDWRLVGSLLADIDSILFELNSVCELMTCLFDKLYAHIGKPIKQGKAGLEIKKVIEANGQNSDWFQRLDNHRNFFMHKGAPYFAVDVSQAPDQYDLLIMKENLKSFDDQTKFFKLSEVNRIVNGFATAKPIIQKHLIGLFR